jgi:hypothetical protein
MTKIEKKKLIRHFNDLNFRVHDKIPTKHKNYPKRYLSFLNRKIDIVSKQLEVKRLKAIGEK